MFNKKNIISAVILIGSIVVSSVSTFAVKGNADEETLQQVKTQLQEQIDSKTLELEDKDKKIEELNKKIEEQDSTINQLNLSVQSLNEGLNNTNAALDSAKKIQKQDKIEVTSHADVGDAQLQKQIDEVKTSNDGFIRDGTVIEPSDKITNKNDAE